MKNFTSLLSARIFYTLCLGSLLLSATLLSPSSFAQNGSPCYKPIIGPGTSAVAVNSGITVSFSTNNGVNNLTNGNTADYAEINNLAQLLGSEGVSVSNSQITYPGGWHAGYVVQFGSAGLLNANVLNGIQLRTYNNGNPVESKTFTEGLGVTLLAGGSGKVYLNFKTTADFDEVRLIFTTTVNAALAASTLKIFYATAFDPACGTLDNNSICEDPIAGNQTVVNFNAGTLNVLATLNNPLNITDGNKNSYAEFVVPANGSLLPTAPFVGVTSLQTRYASGGGRRVGFKIQQQGSLLNASVLNSIRIQTYLHGVKQDDIALDDATALVGASVLSATDAVQKVSIPTTAGKDFNEVRLVIDQSVAATIGTLRIYEAFESGAACTDCEQVLAAGGTYATSSIVGARTGGEFCGAINPLLAGVSVTNTDRVVDASPYTNFATMDFFGVLGSGCEGSISVRDSSASPGRVIPANSFAGFVISKNGSGLLGGLIDLNLLAGIRIRTYKEGVLRNDSQAMGTSLLGLSVLSGGTGQTKVGIKTTLDYDEIRITINFGAISSFLTTGSEFHIHYAFVQRDDDNDGVFDCNDACGTGANDSVDSDGDGQSDACDLCLAAGPFEKYKSATVDTDGDGLANSCDDDSDNDGIPDLIEGGGTTANPNDYDADGDGVPNYLDLDSDNDGITDLQESGVSISGGDANNNGAFDVASHNTTVTPRDTDGDSVPDYLDLDADNDGIYDLYEGGGSGYTDANTDGVVDGPDADYDGLQDSADANDASFGFPASVTPKDQDKDGVPNYRDLDSDNDGINDIVESGKTGLDGNNDGIVDGNTDADGDGIRDIDDSDDVIFGSPGGSAPVDSDGDGVPDNQDLDSDNDTVSDLVESGQTGYADADDDGVVDAGPGADTDGDGIQSSVDGAPGAFGDSGSPTPKNTDSGNDNIPDYKDLDSDNDGINDINENGRGGLDPNNDGRVDNPTDPDGDGIANNGGLDFKPADFGGLGTGTPDLLPVINSAASAYNVAVQRDVLITVFNSGSGSTKAPVVFQVQKMTPVFTIVVEANASTSTIPGATPTNSQWTIVEYSNYFEFTLKDAFSIASLGNKQVLIKVTAANFKGGTATVVAQVTNGSGGGETPTSNNIYNYYISVNQ